LAVAIFTVRVSGNQLMRKPSMAACEQGIYFQESRSARSVVSVILRVAENNRQIVKTECGSDELENVILFFVRTDFAGRVKAQQQIET
jgi:hypothetical protein